MHQTETSPAAQAPAEKPRERGWVWRCTVVVAVPLLIWLIIFIDQRRQPAYEGRRVGEWFDDLCQGALIDHDAARWSAAYRAFASMDSNAAPFLASQLAVDRDGRLERLWMAGRRIPFVSLPAQRIVLPTARRTYAALALGNMGTNGIGAMEALVDSWHNEPHEDAKMNIAIAMASVFGNPQSETRQRTLDRIRSAYPHLFPAPLVPLGTNALAPGMRF